MTIMFSGSKGIIPSQHTQTLAPYRRDDTQYFLFLLSLRLNVFPPAFSPPRSFPPKAVRLRCKILHRANLLTTYATPPANCWFSEFPWPRGYWEVSGQQLEMENCPKDNSMLRLGRRPWGAADR